MARCGGTGHSGGSKVGGQPGRIVFNLEKGEHSNISHDSGTQGTVKSAWGQTPHGSIYRKSLKYQIPRDREQNGGSQVLRRTDGMEFVFNGDRVSFGVMT